MRYYSNSPYPGRFAITTSEKDYQKEMKRLNVDNAGSWLMEGAPATCHAFHSDTGGLTQIICICPEQSKGQSVISIISLIAHECVHIVQEIYKFAGERVPSSEIEAYLFQFVLNKCLTSISEGA